MLGDNSDQSKDSRLWDKVGPHLVGRGENYQVGTVPGRSIDRPGILRILAQRFTNFGNPVPEEFRVDSEFRAHEVDTLILALIKDHCINGRA